MIIICTSITLSLKDLKAFDVYYLFNPYKCPLRRGIIIPILHRVQNSLDPSVITARYKVNFVSQAFGKEVN